MHRRAPKRRIERVKARLDHSLTDTATAITLHTAEDAKTLVRALIDVEIYSVSTAKDEDTYGLFLHVAPRGQSVIGTGALSEVLDISVPLQEICEIQGQSLNRDAAANESMHPTRIYRDIKAMRKLKTDDEIQWTDFADSNAKVRVVGIIYLWFKE